MERIAETFLARPNTVPAWEAFKASDDAPPLTERFRKVEGSGDGSRARSTVLIMHRDPCQGRAEGGRDRPETCRAGFGLAAIKAGGGVARAAHFVKD